MTTLFGFSLQIIMPPPRKRLGLSARKAAELAEKRERERKAQYVETVYMRRISSAFLKADISPELAAALVLDKLKEVRFNQIINILHQLSV